MRPPRDRSITPLGFTCFHLVPNDEPGADEPAYSPIELCVPPRQMGALSLVR